MADTKVIHGIAINTKHELDLELIAKHGGIPQEPDPVTEAFERGEWSLTPEMIKTGAEITSSLFDREDSAWMDQFRKKDA